MSSMNTNNVKFCIMEGRKTRNPERVHTRDAGIDIFAPLDMKKYVLHPQESVLIHTGLRAIVPEGFCMVATNKSGFCSKKLIIHGACLIDEGYRGEIVINLINVGKEIQEINPGDKISQLVLYPVGYNSVEMIGEDEYVQYEETDRGNGGFGSTGN